jgi:putative transposase
MNNKSEHHHRRSIRLKGYDYSREGLYFITICVHKGQCLFGNIENQKMILTDVGKFAYQCWQDIPVHFQQVVLHDFIIMPNHVHGIIELKYDMVGVQTVGAQNLEPQNLVPKNHFQKIIPQSIGSIVRGYKIGVTKWYRDQIVLDQPVRAQNIEPKISCPIPSVGAQNLEPLPLWHRNYYEHIIRNEQSYQYISEYIINNPLNWDTDTLRTGTKFCAPTRTGSTS